MKSAASALSARKNLSQEKVSFSFPQNLMVRRNTLEMHSLLRSVLNLNIFTISIVLSSFISLPFRVLKFENAKKRKKEKVKRNSIIFLLQHVFMEIGITAKTKFPF